MATDRSNDVRAFRDFLDEKLSQGASNLTLEEALGLWEIQTQQPATERQGNVQALREGLGDMRAGDTGIPIRQFRAGARRKHDRPGRPGVPTSSRVGAESFSEVHPSSNVLRRSRWLD